MLGWRAKFRPSSDMVFNICFAVIVITLAFLIALRADTARDIVLSSVFLYLILRRIYSWLNGK
jgi:hypothetical protein